MADADPREIIIAGVKANMAIITKDDGITNANVIHMWQGGPEPTKLLFYESPVGGPYDVIFSYGDPRSRSERDVQDVPVHFIMSYPITVTTVDKPLTGVLEVTAARMQYKATYNLRLAIAAFAQSGVGDPTAYTLTLKNDASVMRRVGGITLWETRHVAEYQTDYA